MIFDTIPVGQIDTNCYLVGDEAAKACAVVDPGGSPERVLSMIEKSGLTPQMILLTHGHWDHVGAIPALLEKWPDLPVYAHEKELCPADEPNPHYFFPHAGKNQRTYGEGPSYPGPLGGQRGDPGGGRDALRGYPVCRDLRTVRSDGGRRGNDAAVPETPGGAGGGLQGLPRPRGAVHSGA